jgi:hypothetical protein
MPFGRQHRGVDLSRVERLLDVVYAEPDPFETAEEFERAHHGDIASLPLDLIDAERILARLRWAVLIHRRAPVTSWLEERIARLDQAASRLRQQKAQRQRR